LRDIADVAGSGIFQVRVNQEIGRDAGLVGSEDNSQEERLPVGVGEDVLLDPVLAVTIFVDHTIGER
jgi:hypothetical protein